MKNFKTNTKVEWDWGNGIATGYIVEKFTEKVSKQNEVLQRAQKSKLIYRCEEFYNE